MVRGRWPSIIVGIALLAVMAVLAGCGGDGIPIPGTPGGGGPPPPPPAGTAAVEGKVVDSENVRTVIAGAEVRLVGENPAVATDGSGRFALKELPAGSVTLRVTFPSNASYQPMDLSVPTAAHQTTHVTIAALHDDVAAPTSVTLAPAAAQVDIGGDLQFTADVRLYGSPVSLMPSLSLLGDIGTLTPSGRFTATKIGTGTVTAILETTSATATVEVVASQPPQLGTLSVSPNSLPDEGGWVRIAIAVKDGDGVKDDPEGVIAQIEKPNRRIQEVALRRETGTVRDGSWGVEWKAPANNNPPGPDGTQLEQRYSVRVKVTDRTGVVVLSKWETFVVAGVEPPPAWP